jgi:hypothetical protein
MSSPIKKQVELPIWDDAEEYDEPIIFETIKSKPFCKALKCFNKRIFMLKVILCIFLLGILGFLMFYLMQQIERGMFFFLQDF